jgi:hypothetical protein
MNFLIVAALALVVPVSPSPAGAPLATDLRYTMPIAGSWAYASRTDGSEASFADSSGNPQLTIRCTRSTRRVTILKSAVAASPTMWVWTSSQIRTLPATYDSATGQVSADLQAYDPLLDALASSRGRIGVSTSGLAALVAPPWAETARVIEDCRV